MVLDYLFETTTSFLSWQQKTNVLAAVGGMAFVRVQPHTDLRIIISPVETDRSSSAEFSPGLGDLFLSIYSHFRDASIGICMDA